MLDSQDERIAWRKVDSQQTFPKCLAALSILVPGQAQREKLRVRGSALRSLHCIWRDHTGMSRLQDGVRKMLISNRRSDVSENDLCCYMSSLRGSTELSTSLDLHISSPTGLVSNGHHLQFFIGEFLCPQSLLCSPTQARRIRKLKFPWEQRLPETDGRWGIYTSYKYLYQYKYPSSLLCHLEWDDAELQSLLQRF